MGLFVINYTFYLALLSLLLLTGCNSNPTYTASTSPGVLIIQDNLDGLRHHIGTLSNINELDAAQMSLLHKATIFDKPKSAELLLSLGADVNTKGPAGITPLFYTNSVAMLNILKRYYVNIHAVSATGLNALSHINNADTIEALIKAGADPTLESAYGQTALTVAYAQVDIYEKLISDSDKASVKKIFQKNIVTVKDKIKILEKYVSLSPAPKIITLARKGDLAGVKQQVKKVNIITTTDISGNTALHVAAKANQLSVVKFLANTRKLLNTKNKYGHTALATVAQSKSDSAKYLSCRMNKYCKSPKSFASRINQACTKSSSMKKCEQLIRQDIHSVFITFDLAVRAKNIRFNDSCKQFNYIKCKQLQSPSNDRIYTQKIDAAIQLHSPAIEKKFIAACNTKSNKIRCIKFANTYPNFKSQKEINYALLILSQKCRIKEPGWIYKGKQCKAGYAHGNGEAINNNKQLSYNGQFTNGQRTNGKVFYNNTPMYDGAMKNGKPNGVGVCFHEGEPEECKYYTGKRIDSLYKQRIEMAKQQKMMDEKLAQMQQAQNKQLQQMQTRMNHQPARGTKSKTMGDVIIDKAMDKAMDKVFDSLF